jgi:hypothetical protein
VNKADEVGAEEKEMSNLANNLLAGECHDTEVIIDAADFHVMQAKSM